MLPHRQPIAKRRLCNQQPRISTNGVRRLIQFFVSFVLPVGKSTIISSLSFFLAFLLLNTPESVSETGKCANYSNPLPPAAPPLMTSHWVKNPRHPRISLPPPPPPASPGDGTEQQR